ncbi:MAG: GntR family transcriptional regulator [Thalassolituus oleivorans]|uniref:FadR/GntR family transcriptional regulator n=1 Tax=Thalassolituus oleivorans TaxID=187493 RepID=UPI001B5C5F35|nr:GntR family transcriptional regulator [Thalassolituus oleivorans]MBQ0726424.1 GntR family transcriptional regulator [Thalassolituus oleivorans]MBQ0781099.1 GntR family transcriptional regulator [Thalassolituus oleivorans]
MTKTLPDQVADLIISLIFIRDLKPGDKLPPERKFAEQLGVDRTSLRMALRTLGRMNIIDSVQGSGIRIGDIEQDAGLDFLDNLYRIPELELGGRLLISGLEMFNQAVPMGMRLAMLRRINAGFSAENGRTASLVQEMYTAVNAGVDNKTLARLEVDVTDSLMAASDNLVLKASSTSSRRIRLLLTEKLFELIDVKAHLNHQLKLLHTAREDNVDVELMISNYLEYMATLTKPLLEHLATLPPEPRLISSPLKNGLNITSMAQLL